MKRFPLLPVVLALLSGCVSQIRYDYPRLSQEADLALWRVARSIEVAEDDELDLRGATPAAEAIAEARAAIDGDAAVSALGTAAEKLDRATLEARAAMRGERRPGRRDLHLDFAEQAERAAFEVRTLARAIEDHN